MVVNTNHFTLTPEETTIAEKFHYLLERNMRSYWLWFQERWHNNLDSYFITKELTDKISEYTQSISANAACSTGYYGMTIMHYLVTNHYYAEVELLLKKGVNPDIRGSEGKGDYIDCYQGVTPLHIACYSGNYKMAKLLLEYGADTTLQDGHGRNCYHYLAEISCKVRGYQECNSKDIANQRLRIAKLLKCDINQKDDEGITPLIYLVKNEARNAGSLFLIQHFIDCGADVTATDGEGNNALMLATENVHITAAYTLMQDSKIINLQNHAGDTALHRAFDTLGTTSCFNPATVYMLMEKGADCHIKNQEGQSVSDYVEAMEQTSYTELVKKCIFREEFSFDDYFEILSDFTVLSTYCGTYGWQETRYDDYNVFVQRIARDILKKVDIDDDTETVYIKKILEKLLRAHNGYAVIPLILEEGYDLRMRLYDRGEVTTIRDICLKDIMYDLEETIPKMQELGVDINEALVDGCTPAFLLVDGVCRNSDVRIYERVAKVLKFFSAESMEQLNNQGHAAIHVAAGIHKNTLMLESMIEEGVNVDVATDVPEVVGNTPLHIACIHNNVETAILLKEAGADDSMLNAEEETPAYCLFEEQRYYKSESAYKILEILDDVDTPKAETGETPILHMLRKNYLGVKEMVELFIAKGVRINGADHKGNTPLLMHADHGCNREVIKLLLSAGADINARNSDGNNALLFVLKRGDCELARFLIKKGADYNIINRKGETPSAIAVEKGYDTVLELMTDITVFSLEEDYETELDDYEEEEVDEEDAGDSTEQQYMAILNGYVQMYGEDKGKRLADIAVRMTEMSQNGLTQDNMEEYMRLTTGFQEIMQTTDTLQTQEVERPLKPEPPQREMQSYEAGIAETEMFQDKTGMFEDFNFKLVVISSLLEKKTSFSDKLTEMLEEYVDPYDGDDFECIPEMVEYFENLRLTETDLAQVKNLVFDGGEEIYCMLMPNWDGESDEFDVRSVKGFEHLTNLEEVEYISMCDEKLMEVFEEAGIEVFGI